MTEKLPEFPETVDSATGELASRLRQAIAKGEHPPYEPMPSYREVAEQHSVSLWTVRAAFDRLEREGLVERYERRGTFARPTLAARPSRPGTLRCVNIVEYERRPNRPAAEFIRSDCLVGYTQALEHTEAKLRFASLPPEDADFEAALSPVFPHSEQGCVLHGILSREVFEWLREANIQFVVQHAHSYTRSELPGHHKVFGNKTRGAFDATNHLLGLGHQRIGFIGELARLDCLGPPPVFDGYRSALACSGLEPNDADVVEFSTDHLDAARGPAREYLDRPGLPTAVLAQTDSVAIALLEQAKLLGLRVPTDISVVGINNQAESAYTDPPLTTMTTPRKALARAAVEMLFQAAQGKFDDFQTRVLECRLVRRGSAGPPR